jgi:hypothetical protein
LLGNEGIKRQSVFGPLCSPSPLSGARTGGAPENSPGSPFNAGKPAREKGVRKVVQSIGRSKERPGRQAGGETPPLRSGNGRRIGEEGKSLKVLVRCSSSGCMGRHEVARTPVVVLHGGFVSPKGQDIRLHADGRVTGLCPRCGRRYEHDPGAVEAGSER